MKKLIQLVYTAKTTSYAVELGKRLAKSHLFDVELTRGYINDDELAALLLTKNTTLSDLEMRNPWLQEQFKKQNYRHLRLIPVVVYHSSTDNLEEIYQSKIAKVYDALISPEFKPFAFDLDKAGVEEELNRTIEENYSE